MLLLGCGLLDELGPLAGAAVPALRTVATGGCVVQLLCCGALEML
jgi:hypothetical protein